MRSLYWKIFLSFWLTTTLVIITIAWVTSEIAKSSSIPEHERVFMDSYANAAVMTLEQGNENALKQWLLKTGEEKDMDLYLLTSKGDVYGEEKPPIEIQNVGHNLVNNQLVEGLLKSGNIVVSHEILSVKGTAYRLAAVSNKPLAHLVSIPWASLSLRLIIATLITGLICYFLSLYLTKPLRSLRNTAKSLAEGQLSARVGQLTGHQKDEIAELSEDFDLMAEKLQSLLQSKDRLLQDISHELRTPLARLQIALALARKKTHQTAEKEFDRMEIEAERLNKLIGEILEFARLEQGNNKTAKTEVNLNKVIEQIIADAQFEFSLNASRLQFNPSDSCVIFGVERLLHRAIENIIRNALRYSPENEPVMISMHFNANKTEVYIKIQDNGPGIPEAELKHVFNPFYRVDTAREEKTGGFGLGLAIAQQAVTLHHGQLSVINQAHGGLKVIMTLPIFTDAVANP